MKSVISGLKTQTENAWRKLISVARMPSPSRGMGAWVAESEVDETLEKAECL